MKTRILSLTFALSLVFGLLGACSSCSSSEPIYTVSDETRTYEVFGTVNRANRIRVTENGKTVWEKKINAKKTVGNYNGTYGFEILDLNFDGINDFKIAIDVSGEVVTNLCYLRTADTGSYEKSDILSELCNVAVNLDQQAIFSFSHTRIDEKEYEDAPASYTTIDTTTAYVWKNDSLIPYRRVSLTYYSARDIYCYSVSDYSEAIFEFLDSDDTWLTPGEYAATDFGFLYYFR